MRGALSLLFVRYPPKAVCPAMFYRLSKNGISVSQLWHLAQPILMVVAI